MLHILFKAFMLLFTIFCFWVAVKAYKDKSTHELIYWSFMAIFNYITYTDIGW